MKSKYIIFLLLFSIVSYGQTQEKKSIFLTYTFSYQTDSTNISSVLNEQMHLIIASNKSLFLSSGSLLGDSLKKIGDQDKIIAAMKKMAKSKIKSRIYKFQNSKEIIFTDRVLKDKYTYTEKLNIFKWTLKDSIKTIQGYKCNQAKTFFGGRIYTAWYSKSIPISEGPYKFNGLPSLILEIYDSKKQISYTLTTLKTINDDINISKPENYIQVRKCQFFKVRKEKYGNIKNSFKEAGIHIAFSEAKWHELQESYDKKNNPIELNCK